MRGATIVSARRSTFYKGGREMRTRRGKASNLAGTLLVSLLGLTAVASANPMPCSDGLSSAADGGTQKSLAAAPTAPNAMLALDLATPGAAESAGASIAEAGTIDLPTPDFELSPHRLLAADLAPAGSPEVAAVLWPIPRPEGVQPADAVGVRETGVIGRTGPMAFVGSTWEAQAFDPGALVGEDGPVDVTVVLAGSSRTPLAARAGASSGALGGHAPESAALLLLGLGIVPFLLRR